MNSKQQSSFTLNDIFSFFASVRLTVIVLLTLAVTSVIGTLIPQNQAHEDYFDAYGEVLYRLFSVLDFFDMYRSWWFQFLLLLLVINIIVCSFDRFPAAWKIISGSPVFQLSRFQKSSCQRKISIPSSFDNLQTHIEKTLSGKTKKIQIEHEGERYWMWGEKGRWTRIGVYIVHLSVVFLLAGGLIGSFFGFDGAVNIPEGEAVRNIRLFNSGKLLGLDFEVRCDKFSISFYETGAPSEYRSTLTILEEGIPVLTRDIIVNDPLSYKGINFFQSSYGTLPSQNLILSFRSTASGMEYREKISPGQTVTIPEGLGTFMIKAFNQDQKFMGRSIGNAFVGTLTTNGNEPVEVILPIKFPNFDKMRKGDVIVSVAESENRYYTGLQVTSDPGVWVVYTGFILMIAGCIVAFFMSHQQFCIEIKADGASSAISIYGIANKNKIAMKRKIDMIAEDLIKSLRQL